MSAKLDIRKLGAVFGSRPDLMEGIKSAADNKKLVSLFNDITNHFYDQLDHNGQPAHKKRRVDIEQTNGSAQGTKTTAHKSTTEHALVAAEDDAIYLEISEISISVPQRKKVSLHFTENYLNVQTPGSDKPMKAISYAWKDIEHIFYVPVPEKTQVQHNYILFPRGTCLPSKTDPPTQEPLVFTVPSTAPKQGTISGAGAMTAEAVADTYQSLFNWALNRCLKKVGNDVEITSADATKFHSMVRQPHRPTEKAVHVKAFRGSKDGYLFFLQTGILWGFKKPLMFLPLNRIAALSYTSVLQRTFNVAVEVFVGEGEETEEIEFSMLDQEDYGGIDDYVKNNSLQDGSMAEQRKGKLLLAENRASKKNADAAEEGDPAVANGHVGEDGMTELQRAQLQAEQALQDEEDEEEEDYDPGNESDSGGSGASSIGEDDDDDDDDDDEDEEDEDDGAEDQEDEAAEEEEDEEVPVKEEVPEKKLSKKPSRKPAAKPARQPAKEPAKKPVKKPANQSAKEAVQAPIKSGWATIGNASKTNNDDMDVDEKFDVVG
ncbi:hypothetical protein G7046_g5713 [Stylonectria norvegica]|nr:hypothetical protein G7046_g5713 [Stylonectria norvegica]